MSVNSAKLADCLAVRLHRPCLTLTPIDVSCAWPVFKATTPNDMPLFVKLADPASAMQTRAFLKSVPTTSFLPQVVLDEPYRFDDYDVLVLEWKEAKCVNAEDMSEAQFVSFADGCRRLSTVLAAYRGARCPIGEDDPSLQWEKISAYAVRHPLVGSLLRPLLDIPVARRTYDGHVLVTIHGDLQPKNYGFNGDCFVAVFDFDALTIGLACEDAAYAFTERARRAKLSAVARRRLTGFFLRMVKESLWKCEEWMIAVNHARLRIASRRLDKHPDSPFVAFDIARRDKPLAALAAALEGCSC